MSSAHHGQHTGGGEERPLVIERSGGEIEPKFHVSARHRAAQEPPLSIQPTSASRS